MEDILILLATMGGGLGSFLLGMKHLSEGLQSIGGGGLKRFMSAMTTNRIAGMVTGVVSTVIVQSSSIITVMAHTLFNVAGTVILMPLFIPVVLPAVKAFFPDWATAPATPMAAVHTGFNIVTTLCFLPFTAPFAAAIGAFQRRVLTAFLAGKHLRASVLAELSAESKDLRHAIRTAREGQLRRIGGAGSSPLIALATLDIFNAFDRVRSCLINIAETLAGGKRTTPTKSAHKNEETA